MTVQPGTVLAGKYRVERILGQGGMGVVVAATHLQLDKRVALKFLLPEVSKNRELVARFSNEARAAGKIQSEHVAKMLDVGALEDGAPYLVMEYLEGSDLAAVLRARGALPGQEAIGYVLQACEALAEAHVAGIVHRDLKPANLFLTSRADGSPCIKVLDFGISKAALAGAEGGLTQTSAMMGSPNYMAPEQLRSARHVDARADIWALGITLHELLTGEVAFQAESVAELYVYILQNPPAPLRLRRPEAPPGVEAIIFRCLEKDPNRRFANVGELAAALGEFARPEARISVERISRIVAASFGGRPSAPGQAAAGPPAPSAGYRGQGHNAGYAAGPGHGPPSTPPPGYAPLAGPFPSFAPSAGYGAGAPAPPAGMHPSTIALIVLVILVVLGLGGCGLCLCLGAAAGSNGG
jgi:eukaryotic-like serine/threonine-protein kinase